MSITRSFPERFFRMQALRYIFSGCTATLSNLAIFYVLTNELGVYYLFASALSFSAGFVVSFTLHKIVTFQDRRMERVHVQMGLYLLFQIFNTLLGLALLHIFVAYASLQPVAGQALAVALVAFESFFVYRHFVFSSAIVLQSDSHGPHTSLESQTTE